MWKKDIKLPAGFISSADQDNYNVYWTGSAAKVKVETFYLSNPDLKVKVEVAIKKFLTRLDKKRFIGIIDYLHCQEGWGFIRPLRKSKINPKTCKVYFEKQQLTGSLTNFTIGQRVIYIIDGEWPTGPKAKRVQPINS